MRVVKTQEAQKLTGLSTAKQREWTSRRALIASELRPRSRGFPAQYMWQTILLLEIAVILREYVHLELHAYHHIVGSLRRSSENFACLALGEVARYSR